MSDDEQEQEVDNRTIRGNSKNGRQTASFPSPALATSTKPSEVSERSPRTRSTSQWPPEHVPMQMRTDDESNSEDE